MQFEPFDGWHEFVIESFVESIEALGVDVNTKPVKLMGGGTRQSPVVHFSGFWSQGDGACFAGHVSDPVKWALSAGYSSREARNIKRLVDTGELSLKATSGNRYPNQLCEVEFYRDRKPHTCIAKLVADLERQWSEWCAEQSHKLYRDLEREYEYQQAGGELRMLREAMASERESVVACVQEVRDMRTTGIANPRQYERALSDLECAWESYREATDKAFEVARYARRHGIAWGDCSP